MRLIPPKDWWFGIPPGREGQWWRAHVPAHVGHGAFFYLVWMLIGVGNPILAAVFFAVLWEAIQAEFWQTMEFYSNLWDVLLACGGITLAVLLTGCASPTEPCPPTTWTPMVNAVGDTVSWVGVGMCVP